MKDLTQGSVMRHLVPHGRVFGCQHGGANALFARRSLLGRPSRQRSDRGSRRGWKPNDDRAGSDASARRRNDHTYIARCRTKRSAARRAHIQPIVHDVDLGWPGAGVCGFAVRTVYCDSLSADAITAELAKKYLLWFIPSLALQFPLVALGSALRATGVIKPAVGFPVLSVLLNIALAPLLIFGIGPWPRLGVIGAALATFISILIADIMIVIYFEKKYHYLRFRLPLLRPQIKIWRQMLAIGVPAGAEFVLLFVYILLVYVIIRGFGPASQAGFGVGARVMQALFLPVVALSFAVAPVVGQNFGGRRADRVRQSVYAALEIASALMFILTLIAYLVPNALIRVFSQDPRVIAFRGDYLKIVSLNFRGCRNRLYRFQCVPRNGQYPAAVAQLNNTP
jgi:putative MATE family efflux protein